MSFESNGEERRRHRRQVARVKHSLRGLRSSLGVLNHEVGERVSLKGADLDCLDVIGLHGPLTPSELSRLTGTHPATLTGVLDRLERGGWIERERDPAAPDRRRVEVRALPGRARELAGHLAGMNAAMDDVCARFSAAELELIAEFIAETATAGRVAAETLRTPSPRG